MACDMHPDGKPQVQSMDHAMMSHHDMTNHHADEQPVQDEMQHDCCSDEATCLMSSCVATTYLAANSTLTIIYTASGIFLDQDQAQPQTALLNPYRPPIIA